MRALARSEEVAQGSKMITQDELKEMLHYDPLTGLFTWLVAMGPRARPGGRAGGLNGDDYIQIIIRKVRYKAHRLAWLYAYGSFPPDYTDHINGIKTDNRLCNLRPATTSQNNRNVGVRSSNSSGFKGVSWHKRHEKWQSRCRANGKQNNLGRFATAEAASAAYQAFAAKHHGEFYHV